MISRPPNDHVSTACEITDNLSSIDINETFKNKRYAEAVILNII